jgi:hypothetical protein
MSLARVDRTMRILSVKTGHEQARLNAVSPIEKMLFRREQHGLPPVLFVKVPVTTTSQKEGGGYLVYK